MIDPEELKSFDEVRERIGSLREKEFEREYREAMEMHPDPHPEKVRELEMMKELKRITKSIEVTLVKDRKDILKSKEEGLKKKLQIREPKITGYALRYVGKLDDNGNSYYWSANTVCWTHKKERTLFKHNEMDSFSEELLKRGDLEDHKYEWVSVDTNGNEVVFTKAKTQPADAPKQDDTPKQDNAGTW